MAKIDLRSAYCDGLILEGERVCFNDLIPRDNYVLIYGQRYNLINKVWCTGRIYFEDNIFKIKNFIISSHEFGIFLLRKNDDEINANIKLLRDVYFQNRKYGLETTYNLFSDYKGFPYAKFTISLLKPILVKIPDDKSDPCLYFPEHTLYRHTL